MRRLTKYLLAIAVCGTVVTVTASYPAAAQTETKKKSLGERIKDAANKVDKFLCGPDGTQCEPRPNGSSGSLAGGSTTAQQGGATGSRIRILTPGVFENADLYSAKFDTSGSGLTREPRPCSELSRPCVAGWDLRMLSVAAPADTVPNNADFPVLITLENRGRLPSPASEVKICFTSTYSTACQRGVGLVEIPSLKGGERLQLKQPVRLAQNENSFRIAALIDPDNANAERSRENNSGISAQLSAGRPEIDWITFETSPSPRAKGEPQGFSLRIRNKSFSTKTLPTEIAFGANNGCGGDARFVTPLPAIGPRQIYSLRVMMACDTEMLGASGHFFAAIKSTEIANSHSPIIFVPGR